MDRADVTEGYWTTRGRNGVTRAEMDMRREAVISPYRPDNVAIGARVRELRLKSQMTKNDLARACGVTTPAVDQWERGVTKPDTANLAFLADQIFDVPLEWLLYGKDAQSKDPDKVKLRPVTKSSEVDPFRSSWYGAEP